MNLITAYEKTRNLTLNLTKNLEVEDHCVQVTSDISPIKWHLGHTTWFFEYFILKNYADNYELNNKFLLFFNSYYQSIADPIKQADRGKFSRPTLKEILNYRKEVDLGIKLLLEKKQNLEVQSLLTLGINHEQQHQELILMDIKNNFYYQDQALAYSSKEMEKTEDHFNGEYQRFEGGLHCFGYKGHDFCYDNEVSSHKFYLKSFWLKNKLETNGDYLEFVEAQGYSRPEFWHADGYDYIQKNNIKAPLYWFKKNKTWYEYTLHGEQPLNLKLPVMHMSYYEAFAYARYRHKRLPSEYEWELVARNLTQTQSLHGHFLKDRYHLPATNYPFRDLIGSLWQWTSSDYAPYPNHVWKEGALGEYNSKFMINQKVLRGGSFATPESHFRVTYRNYYLPEKRWAFTGIRLAGDEYE